MKVQTTKERPSPTKLFFHLVLCTDLDMQGTGGDIIILEEAAYCDPGFFFETGVHLNYYYKPDRF